MDATQGTPRRLVRYSSAGRVAGVCAGIAEYLETDVTLVRLAWVVLSIVPGAFLGGLTAYLAAWIVMPGAAGSAPAAVPTDRRFPRSIVHGAIAGVCGGSAVDETVASTAVRVGW